MYKRQLNQREQEERAKNAVAQLLMSKLIVPKIFFEVSWPTAHRRPVDLFAVDRAGAGDIHLVEIKSGKSVPLDIVAKLMSMPAHFKYLALIGNDNYRPDDSPFYYDKTGLGRIGVIQISEDNAGNLAANLIVAPERFRVEPRMIKSADAFLSKHTPDFEIRY